MDLPNKRPADLPEDFGKSKRFKVDEENEMFPMEFGSNKFKTKPEKKIEK
jgi:hypothetical protein